MTRLTITYRTVRERKDFSNSSLREFAPGRANEIDVEFYYVRDGALFYAEAGSPRVERMVPLDLIYHYAGEEL